MNAANIFIQARKFTLQTQRRAIEDPEHSNLVARMGSGDGLHVDDLDRYKILGSNDIHENKAWIFAPIIVTSNMERIAIIHSQLHRFAKMNRRMIVRWKNKGTNVWCWGRPLDNTELNESPFMYEYFVEGISGYLTANLNVDLNLANGTAVKYHSLEFRNDEQLDEYMIQAHKDADYCPDQVNYITLQEPPQAINVQLQDTRSLSENQQTCFQQMKMMVSADVQSENFIFPIFPSAKRKAETVDIPINNKAEFQCFRTERVPYFPLEAAFALTVHKVQGKTMNYEMLAISSRPNRQLQMSYESIYVALSRVRSSEHLRLILHGNEKASLDYCTKLKPNVHTVRFLKGYSTEGIWNYENID